MCSWPSSLTPTASCTKCGITSIPTIPGGKREFARWTRAGRVGVRDYFQRVDESLARLLDAARTIETLVIVLSDHGMGQANNFIVLNNWLLDTGLLRLKRDPWTRLKESSCSAAALPCATSTKLLDRLGLAQQAEYVAGYFVDHLLKLVFLSFLDVDWSHSRAYSFGRHLGSIYVNVKGREPQGIVEPGAEYEAVRDEIERLAREFRDPRTGRPLIGQVIRREEVYSGPYLDQAPDLILRPSDPSDIFFGLADFGHRNTVDTVYRYSGMHRDDGMLIMNGPGIRAGRRTHRTRSSMTWRPRCCTPWACLCRRTWTAVSWRMPSWPATWTSFPQSSGADGGAGRRAPQAAAALDYTEQGEKEVMDRLQGLGYLG